MQPQSLADPNTPSTPVPTTLAHQHSGMLPVPSEHLLRGSSLVHIAHKGQLYKLQTTKLGKLILTK